MKPILLPLALTTLRLALGPVALLAAFAGAPRWIYLPILVTGTMSDIFDGVLARRLGVASPALRRYDSVADVIYYLFILGTVWIVSRAVVVEHIWAIAVLVGFEAASIAVSYARFGTYPAVHSYLAKFYGLCLLATLIGVLVFQASGGIVLALVAVGLASNAEIILIHFLVDTPPVDIRSIFLLPRRHR